MHKRVSRLEAMRIMRAARQFREQHAALEAQAAASVGVSIPQNNSTESNIPIEDTQKNIKKKSFLSRIYSILVNL